MPRFSPFRGVRYDAERTPLHLGTAPPYDVIDGPQRAALVDRHPDNVVRIDLPESEDGADPYEVAPRLLDRWLTDGVLVRDPEPSFYVHRMDFVDDEGEQRSTVGALGALELERPGEGGILPHEHTTPKAKSDRLRMLQTCRANLSAVWGLVPAPGLSELLTIDESPIGDFTDPDGVRHRLWVVSDEPRVRAIGDSVGSVPVVIADGHHRFETSLAYRDERRLADGGGPWDDTLLWAVELAETQLCVRPIHRLLHGLEDPTSLVDSLGGSFEVEPYLDPSSLTEATVADLVSRGALALVLADESFLLRPRDGAFEGVRDLDTARLDAALAAAAPHELTFQHGGENVVRRVRDGEAAAGVLLRPASVDQILDIAHGGERMPPKTTFFHPKPPTGLVVRLLDE